MNDAKIRSVNTIFGLNGFSPMKGKIILRS